MARARRLSVWARHLVLPVATLCAQPMLAQTEPPLSVIDWLGTQSETRAALPSATPEVEEPPVSENALAPTVTVQPLGQGRPREIGLVPTSITGLPPELWEGSDVARLITLFDKLPDLTLPAAQALLYTLLLAEARAPGNAVTAGDSLALARVAKLQEYGALDPALSLIEQAGVTTSPAHFDLWMQISLLNGTEDRACDVLRDQPHLAEDYGTRIFCAARAGNWDNAALTFGSAQALKLMSSERLALFDRFLHPENFEDVASLPAPRHMDPLSFRLFETLGDPVPTSTLPRPYAVSDLRDLSGWKAQLEAAERLTRAGALPDNRLLGLYTDRKAAASGGVWDRVAALQRFETALETGSAEAVRKTLPPAWEGMQDAGLEVSFAGLFVDAIEGVPLEGRAQEVATEIGLLSHKYEHAAQAAGTQGFAIQIAFGEVPALRPTGVIPGAIFDAFNNAAPRADLVAMVRQARLGEAVLHLLPLLHDGAQGKSRALTDALATLRALGLEDTARRAALQILLIQD